MAPPTARRPLWTLLFFSFGIVLPGGLLLFLGARSLRYERALIQQQSRERHAATVQDVEGRIDNYFSNLRDGVAALARSRAFEQWDLPRIRRELLAPSARAKAPARRLYLFEGENVPAFPHWQTPLPQTMTLDWGPHADEIRRLEKLEFAAKDPMAAVRGYETLAKEALSPPQQAALLKYLAGAFRKAGEPSRAEAAYLELIRGFDGLPDPAGYETGVTARQLLAGLYEKIGGPAKAADVRLELAEGLVFGRWPAADAQVDRLWKKEVRPLLDAAGEDPRWRDVQTAKERLAALAEDAQGFSGRDWPKLVDGLHRKGWLDTGGVFRLNGRTHVVVPVGRRGFLAALVEGETLEKDIDALLRTHPDLPARRLASPAGGMSSLWRPAVRGAASSIEPPLEFELQLPAADPGDALHRRRIWIFGGMLGLSFLVAAAGLALMSQAVRREMENAALKAEFMANVSHEIKTPLASISYIGERLRSGRFRSPQEAREFYEMLGEETERLQTLVNDVLDFSKMLSGRKGYRREPVDGAALAREAHARFAGKARARGFQVDLRLPDGPVPLSLDFRATLQALLNLLDNALKYSGDSRSIELSLRREEGGAAFSVKDQGIGIPPAEQGRIFDKFYRVEQAMTRSSEGGVGLGLAMVKHCAENQGGAVRLESAPGKGSVFTLWFPKEVP